MSRIGNAPIAVPKGVTITTSGRTISAKGPKGNMSFEMPPGITLENTDGTLRFKRENESNKVRALHGLTRSLIANMVEGVTQGYKKQLEITGVGYKAEVKPFGLQLALGYSHPVEYRAPVGIKLTAPQPTVVVIEGSDKEKVGQVAAKIRQLRKPEPYKGKGVKYQGEQIRRKAGKAGGK